VDATLEKHARREDLDWFVIKDANPLTDQNNEGAMFLAVQGRFGIPEVLGHYVVKHHQHVDENIPPKDATHYPIFGSSPGVGVPRPEKRLHVRTIIKTYGKSLVHAASPRELVRALLHGMLGTSSR
jgi:hypothetical protein